MSASVEKQKVFVQLLCVCLRKASIKEFQGTHWVLNHLHSLSSEVLDNSGNVHHSLLCNLIQNSVYGDECPRPPHSSTAHHTHTHHYNTHTHTEKGSFKTPSQITVKYHTHIPAVDQQRTFRWPVLFPHLLVEGQDGRGIVRHSVIRPGCEVELSDRQLTL